MQRGEKGWTEGGVCDCSEVLARSVSGEARAREARVRFQSGSNGGIEQKYTTNSSYYLFWWACSGGIHLILSQYRYFLYWL